MEDGSGGLIIGLFLPAPMPNGFLATGGVSQVAEFGLPGIEDTGDVTPYLRHEAQIFLKE
jgi:hypothetical protein